MQAESIIYEYNFLSVSDYSLNLIMAVAGIEGGGGVEWNERLRVVLEHLATAIRGGGWGNPGKRMGICLLLGGWGTEIFRLFVV